MWCSHTSILAWYFSLSLCLPVLQRDFALKHLPDDSMFKLVSKLYETVPGVLQATGKVCHHLASTLPGQVVTLIKDFVTPGQVLTVYVITDTFVHEKS